MFDKSIIQKIDEMGFDEVLGEFCQHDGKIDFDEVHAISYGFMVSINPTKPRFNLDDIPIDYPQDIKDLLLKEHHYYTMGRTAGDCLKVAIVGALTYYGYAKFFA